MMKQNNETKIIAYTDGGCKVNPGGPGGYGVVVVNTETGEIRECTGGYESTTNNRMEIMAILRALEVTSGEKGPVTVHSDSQYAINCAQGTWKRNKNKDLWARYEDLTKGRDVRFVRVRGHAGNELNERCDQLATMAMERDVKEADLGYEAGVCGI